MRTRDKNGDLDRTRGEISDVEDKLIVEIRVLLDAEGYTLSQLDGSASLRTQLRKLCADARKAKNAGQE